MKISLTISDRVALQNTMPDKDSFENMCLRQEILDKTGFSSDEIDKNKIKSIQVGDKSSLTWVETENIEFEFNSAEITYVNANLKKLSEAKELTSIHVSMYKKFISL